mmetsp:Transcript_4006/g.6804  ORF Transcript_4006/g.6804 Transcript_4006/m.6804 type:complete len:563 (+) Transcript_4006:27-1715(+)
MGFVYEHTAALVIAISSLVLYICLLGASIYQIRVQKRLRDASSGGSFVEFKLVFFTVLATSALFSLPLWVGCLLAGSPSTCEWHGPYYYTCWSFHLFALIGFSFCVGIPSIMWSDIINNTQRLHPGTTVSFLGSFRRVFSVPLGSGGRNVDYYQNYDASTTSFVANCSLCRGVRVDYMRFTFVLFVFCYSINELVVIASFIQFYIQDRNVSDFVEHSNIYRVSTYIEPFIIFFFAGNCLFSGISLQLHVRRARLEESMQRKLLTTLNSVLLVVTITYITRAVFVLDLFLEFSGALTYSYFIWIVCTHWMPHLLGSSCLFYLMSSQGSERKHRGKVYKGEGGHGRVSGRRKSKKKNKKRESGSTSTSRNLSRSRSKTSSVNSVDREKLTMSKFSINSETSQNESSMFDGSTSTLDETLDQYTPLLRYNGEDDDDEDGDSSVGSSRQEGSDNDYGGNNEDDDGSDYDSFYDPYYDSQSEDGGAMSRLSHRETFGNGLGSDLGDDNISISSDGISGMIDSLSAEVSANSGSGSGSGRGSGHSHSFFGSVKSAVSSRSGQSRGSQT